MRENSFSTQARRLIELYDEFSAQPGAGAACDRPLIVCIGNTVAEICPETLELLPHYRPGATPRIVMVDWLTDAQIGSAAMLWVTGATDQRAALALAERFCLPMLVPEGDALLAAECRQRNCGLYFADAHEAAACIAYLLDHEDDRRALGANVGGRPSLAVAKREEDHRT